MEKKYFHYSIQTARVLYSKIDSNAEAWQTLNNAIEDFLYSKEEEYEIIETQKGSILSYEYRTENFSIFTQLMGSLENGDFNIHMKMYKNPYAIDLIDSAFNDKSLFGLPVFDVKIIHDNFEEWLPKGYYDMGFIFFISPTLFKKLDKPEVQDLKNKLDELDERFG